MDNNNNQPIDKIINSVKNSVSSIFSKEDVINLLEQTRNNRTFSEDEIDHLCNGFESYIGKEHDHMKFINEKDIELSINHENKVIVETISLNTDNVGDILGQYFHEVNDHQANKTSQL